MVIHINIATLTVALLWFAGGALAILRVMQLVPTGLGVGGGLLVIGASTIYVRMSVGALVERAVRNELAAYQLERLRAVS